jgi:ribosomal protein L11 methyltransferase
VSREPAAGSRAARQSRSPLPATGHRAPGRPRYSRLTIPRKANDDALVGLLSLYGPLGFEERGPDLVAFFRAAPAALAAGQALADSRIRHDLVTDIAEEDPFEAYRAASRPFPVGVRFWIDPGPASAGPNPPPPPGRILLRLPASRAFGTGGHESTRLVLLALEEESLEGKSVLDVGTGSAVLSLAAVALGARRAFGFDSDPEAIFVARENLRLHPFGGRVALVACSPSAIAGSFPLVVANLLPEELFPMKAILLARIEPRGRLIVSGIPAEREAEVLDRLRTRRLTLAACRRENGWTCATLARG